MTQVDHGQYHCHQVIQLLTSLARCQFVSTTISGVETENIVMSSDDTRVGTSWTTTISLLEASIVKITSSSPSRLILLRDYWQQ